MFPSINGTDVSRAANDDVYDFVIAVASGSLSVETIARRLGSLITTERSIGSTAHVLRASSPVTWGSCRRVWG